MVKKRHVSKVLPKRYTGRFVWKPPTKPSYSTPLPPTDKKFELTKPGAEELIQHLPDRPIKIKHELFTPPVGEVTNAYFGGDEDGYVDFVLASSEEGRKAAADIAAGRLRAISLKHDPETMLPIEVSLCVQGARPNTWITKVEDLIPDPLGFVAASSPLDPSTDEEVEEGYLQYPVEEENSPGGYIPTQHEQVIGADRGLEVNFICASEPEMKRYPVSQVMDAIQNGREHIGTPDDITSKIPGMPSGILKKKNPAPSPEETIARLQKQVQFLGTQLQQAQGATNESEDDSTAQQPPEQEQQQAAVSGKTEQAPKRKREEKEPTENDQSEDEDELAAIAKLVQEGHMTATKRAALLKRVEGLTKKLSLTERQKRLSEKERDELMQAAQGNMGMVANTFSKMFKTFLSDEDAKNAEGALAAFMKTPGAAQFNATVGAPFVAASMTAVNALPVAQQDDDEAASEAYIRQLANRKSTGRRAVTNITDDGEFVAASAEDSRLRSAHAVFGVRSMNELAARMNGPLAHDTSSDSRPAKRRQQPQQQQQHSGFIAASDNDPLGGFRIAPPVPEGPNGEKALHLMPKYMRDCLELTRDRSAIDSVRQSLPSLTPTGSRSV